MGRGLCQPIIDMLAEQNKTLLIATNPLSYLEGFFCFVLFFKLQYSVDSDCSHEFRRWLLLGRKAKTNLDSVLKSKDITLQTKVHIVKATVFPIVMYGRRLSAEKLTLFNCDAGEDD